MRSGPDCGRDLRSPEAIGWLADISLGAGPLGCEDAVLANRRTPSVF
jgi:hypothetical protein